MPTGNTQPDATKFFTISENCELRPGSFRSKITGGIIEASAPAIADTVLPFATNAMGVGIVTTIEDLTGGLVTELAKYFANLIQPALVVIKMLFFYIEKNGVFWMKSATPVQRFCSKVRRVSCWMLITVHTRS